MTQDEQLKCPICGENYLLSPGSARQSGFLYDYDCRRCGKFKIDRALARGGIAEGFGEVRHFASAWIRERNRAGVTPVVGEGQDNITDEWVLSFKHMGFPSTVDERINALLKAYADRAKDDMEKKLSRNDPDLIAEVAAKNLKEIEALTSFLHQLGYVVYDAPSSVKPMITAKGWLHVDELRRSRDTSDSAFIAMWFHEHTRAYRDAAIAAVEHCGYKPNVVDQEEFNGFIMDKVVSLIRESRFLVADFTCVREDDDSNKPKVKCGARGGVYWEAGLAYGMDKPVIHTCENNEEAKRRMHFDVDQYNTIYWEAGELETDIRDLNEAVDNPRFAERLALRILATVGPGSAVHD